MPSTVLQIGNAAAEIAGLPQQTSLVGSSNQNAIKILRAVKNASKKDAYRDVDWVALQYEHTFVTDASSSYTLPTDFDRIISETLWDRTNDRQLIGPVTARTWQRYESGLINLTGLSLILRIMGKEGIKVIKIYPSDDTGSTLSFEYVSTKYIRNASGGLIDEIGADSDTFLFDDEIVEAAAAWRLLRILGMGYDTEYAEYQKLVAERASNDGGAPRISMSRRHSSHFSNVPEAGYGN